MATFSSSVVVELPSLRVDSAIVAFFSYFDIENEAKNEHNHPPDPYIKIRVLT
jgi:hypothetical protein